MSTFEERQRARVNALLAETMDDVASEMRKAVTPPAKSEPEQGVVLALTKAQAFRLRCVLAGALAGDLLDHSSRREVESIRATLRAAEGQPAQTDILTDLPGGYRPLNVIPIGVRQEFEHYVYVNFDSTEFRTWFEKWFATQVRIHGGIKAWLGR